MTDTSTTPGAIVDAIRAVAAHLGRAPSRNEFRAHAQVTDAQVLRHFAGWNEAVRAAGLEPDESNRPLTPDELWRDWAALVRRHRRIPTRLQYKHEGRYSPGVYEKRIGAWSTLPEHFRAWAGDATEWADVVTLLPVRAPAPAPPLPTAPTLDARHARLDGRPTYGDPLDFRGLRHAPVNEQGVVFLFGMIARELGYMVEAVQTGFPDCEAKRQVGPGTWQRVRIEFEYESRNYRDHGHALDGADVLVCWRHNWPDCPPSLEVVELRRVLAQLSADDE